MTEINQNERDVIQGMSDYLGEDFTLSSIKEFVEADYFSSGEQDLWVEIDGYEFRVIHTQVIEDIWTESLIEQIKDCYDLSDLPSFVEIDWEATADNCKVDGMGHHFSGYDGNEAESGNWHIFRNN